MNLVLISIVFAGWFGGMLDSLEQITGREMAVWQTADSSIGLIQAQADEPEETGAARGRPIGGNEQNWGALIVFALGIGLFLTAYLVWGRTPAPKKKKRKKF
ncbi:MAG: hypothetical protein ACP5I1_14460 [Candidatus Hinthialibacter sp.]